MVFDKETYWKNRKENKRAPDPRSPKLLKTPTDIAMGFDDEGKMYAKTRAMRRAKKPTLNIYTKATHAIKKARNKK